MRTTHEGIGEGLGWKSGRWKDKEKRGVLRREGGEEGGGGEVADFAILGAMSKVVLSVKRPEACCIFIIFLASVFMLVI